MHRLASLILIKTLHLVLISRGARFIHIQTLFMSTNRKAYLTCEFNDDNGVQCNVRHTTTGFKKKLNLCKKHYHKTVTPSTTPTVSLVSLNNALKILLPQSFHRKIDQCCHQTKDYSLLSLRVKQQKAKLLERQINVL